MRGWESARSLYYPGNAADHASATNGILSDGSSLLQDEEELRATEGAFHAPSVNVTFKQRGQKCLQLFLLETDLHGTGGRLGDSRKSRAIDFRSLASRLIPLIPFPIASLLLRAHYYRRSRKA